MTSGIVEQGLPVATRGALFAAGPRTTARRSAITLAELVAVVTVSCLVAAIAYSAYRTYQVRTEVAEGLAAASTLIPAVAEYFHRRGEVPAQQSLGSAAAIAAASSTLVSSIAVVDGRIDVVFDMSADPAIAGQRISLTPYETVDRHVVWICGNREPGPGLQPLGFAAGGRRAAQLATTIDARYLSESCR